MKNINIFIKVITIITLINSVYLIGSGRKIQVRIVA